MKFFTTSAKPLGYYCSNAVAAALESQYGSHLENMQPELARELRTALSKLASGEGFSIENLTPEIRSFVSAADDLSMNEIEALIEGITVELNRGGWEELPALRDWLEGEAQTHEIPNAQQLSDDELKAAVEQAWDKANDVVGGSQQ